MTALIDILKQAGFTGQGLQIALAVAMAESSGNARAFNGNASTGDESYGLFQINMLGAMGPERRKRYGLSSNDALFDPLTNAKIAFAMSKGGTNWQPWTTFTSGKYRQFLGSSGSANVGTGGGAGGGTGAGGTPATTPKLDAKTLATLYGLSSSLINSDKSLRDIFKQAVAQQWSPDVFVAHLKNTSWWATQSDTMRQYLTLKYTDPTTFTQRITATANKVNQLAVAVGYGNMLGQGTTLGKMNSVLQQAVMNVMQRGWTDQQITNWLGGAIKFNGGQLGGQAGQDYDKLQAYAYANGLSMSASWYQQQIKAIEGGSTTTEGVLAGLRSQAAAKYSAYSAQIMAGQDALSLAAPFTHAVAQLLELPETSVDLSNKYVAKAMTTPTAKDGDPAGSQYSLWQLENDVRADPLWRKTDNARESVAQTALQIGRDFGMSI